MASSEPAARRKKSGPAPGPAKTGGDALAAAAPKATPWPKAATPQRRTIKKYPNRRLYDTTTSSYITLAQVKDLVLAGEPFEVVDAKSGEVLTRAILLQIILEEEAAGALSSIIRFYGHAMQGLMGTYLEKNVQIMSEMQQKLAEQAGSLSPDVWARWSTLQAPMMQTLMGNYAEQSRKMFAQMQEQMMGAFRIKR